MLENERIEFRQKLREGLTRSRYKLSAKRLYVMKTSLRETIKEA